MADVRLAALAASSVLVTSMVIGNAFHQKQQFYPSVVHLTNSSTSLALLFLQGFVFVMLLGKLLRLIFFGQLRAIEIERLNDRGWYAVLETCMAFTLFRNDFSATFVARFTLLLFTKAFHWLAEDRIDLMARSTMITTIFHLRAIGLLVCLCVCDVLMSSSAYHHLMQNGVTVQLVFGFEYAILLTALFGVLVKYVLYTVDARRDTPFDYKTELLLYNELVVSFIKLSLYLVFIVIMVKLYTIPIFFFRPMYSALRSFKKALFDVRMSRRAINIMNTLYEDATAEHLSSGDNVCIICREEMTPASRAKRLPCAHMFHVRCLRSWFQRQQSCPTCRLDILRSVPPQPAPPPAAAAPAQPAGNNNNNNNSAGNNNNINSGGGGGGNRSTAQDSSQQQQQQQQQQPAMVPGVPFAANMLPNIWQPFNLAAVQQQQQHVPVSGQSSGNTTTATASTGSSGVPPLTASPPLPPSFMSLPLFPPPPMGVGGGGPLQWPRPPAALPQLAALSLQQLQQLEASGRAAVEARVQLLADIGTLLDTAAVLMQQYSQVAPPVPTVPPHQQQQQQQPTTAAPSTRETAGCAEATAAEAGAAQAAAAAGSGSEVKAADEAAKCEAGAAAANFEAGAAAAKSEAGAAAAKSEAGAAASKSEAGAASTSDAEDSSKVEMRQKRLQHFEKLQQQQQQQP